MTITYSFPATLPVNQTIALRHQSEVGKSLKVVKTERDEVIYLLAIEYLGKDQFKLAVSNPSIAPKSWHDFTGSKQFTADVYGGIIRVVETDAYVSETHYADPNSDTWTLVKERPAFKTALPPITAPSGSIEALKEMGIRFNPEDGKTVKKVLTGDDIVIIQTADDEGKYGLYIARKGTTEFVKCKFNGSISKGKNRPAVLKITVPGETVPGEYVEHSLLIPMGNIVEAGAEAKWNDKKLNILCV